MFKAIGIIFVLFQIFAGNLWAQGKGVLRAAADARSEPSARAEVLLRLKKGASVEVLARKGGWVLIQVAPQKGFAFKAWIPAKSVSVVPVPAPPSVAGAPAAKEAPPPASAIPATQKVRDGSVVYTTEEAVYFNLGRTHGVADGATAEVYRAGRIIARCSVAELADQRSLCRASGAKPGDVVRVAVGEAAGGNERSRRPADLPDDEENRRLKTVISAAYSKVVFVPSADVAGRFSSVPLEIGAGHSTWMSSGRRSYQREHVDLAIRNQTLGVADLTTSVDVSTWLWTHRPDNALFRNGTNVQFYVWEASVSHRTPRSPWAYSVGRIRPMNLAGIVSMDGVQAGWTWDRGMGEAGIYGGLLPTLTSLRPSTDASNGGIYFQQSYWITNDLLLREQVRAGMFHGRDAGTRFEVENVLSGQFRRMWDASIDVKAGLGGGKISDPSLDAVRMDLGLRPVEDVRLQAGFRMLERVTAEGPLLPDYMTRRGDLSVLWEWRSWVHVVLSGGAVQEIQGAGRNRAYAGPEIRLPGLMGRRTLLTAGYQQDFGWIDGMMAYVSPQITLANRHRLALRASATRDSIAGQATREYGLTASVQSTIFSWISLRASAYSRFGDGPFGLTGALDLVGQL